MAPEYVRRPPDKCAALKLAGPALSSRFLIPLLTMWGGGLWSDPLERPRGPRGRRGPTAPGTIPRESALGGPGHSAISRAASILVLFKLTHYPRVGCDSRGSSHLPSGETVPSRFGAISLYPLRS